jgi:hypothetical protein
VAHPQIAIFARLAKGGDMPVRTLAGQATKLSRTMHDIRYDATHDELYVTNPFATAILVFRGGADGDEPPIRIIQGPHTELGSVDRLDVDPVHDEIIVPDGNQILVYPRKGVGDVPPLRILKGADTQLRQASTLSVDPINDVLVVGLNSGEHQRNGALLLYGRTDQGNVKPRTVLRGLKSGIVRITQIALNPTRKLIVATQAGEISDMEPEGAYVGAWNYTDDGDIPPLMRINASTLSTLKKPRGVVLDPKHKEVVIADMRLNALITFSWPEIF